MQATIHSQALILCMNMIEEVVWRFIVNRVFYVPCPGRDDDG